jgi:Cd2+/Zn2+-exporting ATPase
MSNNQKLAPCDQQSEENTKSGCCSHKVDLQPMQSAIKTAQGTQTDIRIMQMDCPTEERMIRKRLGNMQGVVSLEFKLLDRVLTVVHSDDALLPILAAIKSLGFEPELSFSDKPVQASPAKGHYVKLSVAAVIAFGSEVIGWLGDYSWLSIIFAAFAIALCGIGTYKKGWVSILNKDLNINALMSIAVTGAFLIGQWPEAAMVMVLFSLAEMIEQHSLQKAGNAIKGLLELSPAMTTVKQQDDSWLEVATKDVVVGAIVRVKPGERISLDGEVIEGSSHVDQAPITGESAVVEKVVSDIVFAGTINGTGSFVFKVSAAAENTTLAAIIRVVEQAQNDKAPIQRFIDKFASVYTPIVFAIAVAIAVIMPLFFGGDWQAWIYKALVLLVIACPCALVISTPVTVVSGLTAAARKGILVKGGVHLEQGRHIEYLALDKTGTITQGKPELSDYIEIESCNTVNFKQIALSLAQMSDHPVSNAISKGLSEQGGLELITVDNFSALLGRGIQGDINQQRYYFANARMAKELELLNKEQIDLVSELEKQAKTLNLLMTDKSLLAIFAVSDKVKPNSAQAIKQLHKLNVKTVMLSGDNQHAANVIGKEVGIGSVAAELLPEDKLKRIKTLQENAVVAMVGDGINDAPALARADLGFAMGALGTDTAIETADVALMDDDLTKIATFISLSKQVHQILVQNISFAIAIKVVFLGITLAGFGDMWMAVFADVGASLLVVANGLRLLNNNT